MFVIVDREQGRYLHQSESDPCWGSFEFATVFITEEDAADVRKALFARPEDYDILPLVILPYDGGELGGVDLAEASDAPLEPAHRSLPR